MHRFIALSKSCKTLGSLGSSLAFLFLLAGCSNPSSTITDAPVTLTSSAQSRDSAVSRTEIDNPLVGQWKIPISNSSSSSQEELLIFTPSEKLYKTTRMLPRDGIAEESQYKINNSNQPWQIDIVRPINPLGDKATIQGIYEFMPDGQLRIQFGNSNSPRPVTFRNDAIILRKISDSFALPPNIRLFKLSKKEAERQANLARQSEGKMIVGSILRTQQAYFLERGQFSAKLEELNLSALPKKNYSYRIEVIDPKKIVQNTATATKDGLISYTGLVYTDLTASSKTPLTSILLCQSNQPTRDAPGKPQIKGKTVRCPIGYSPLN